ncbi:transcription factor GTE6-like [Papaver somniferum]|uniref:transcription factor GTE6-like n=1 Tax=Papaver somniferum TaxID=3469 RepID=UPI000E6F821D|nr:transcription factor GTE6-like [Papaver somniferum]
MEHLDVSILNTAPDIRDCLGMSDAVGDVNTVQQSAPTFNFKDHVDGIVSQVDEIEEKLNGVTQFYSSLTKKQPNNGKGGSAGKEREREKQFLSFKRQQQEAAKRESSSAKRMQELMRQFSTILRQLAQHKWAWPFMQPVDVKGLELHDYYEVIDKPMDFSTIRNNMELKDGTGYKNVREICADVRLVFKNAMTYNEEKSDVHVMAKTLLAKFEEKWLQLLPKVVEEETKRKEEEAEAHRDMQLVQEAANAKLARDISNELYEVDMHLDELREMVVQKCRKMSAEEKKKLGTGLSQLSPEDLDKALDIIAQKNPNFEATAAEVDIDMDAQPESTLWRLKILVKEGLEVKAKSSATKAANDNSKRKREICDALAKTAKKRSKKTSSNVDPLS